MFQRQHTGNWKAHGVLAKGVRFTICCVLLTAAAHADTVSLTLNADYPSAYTFYSYTATDGSAQDAPVAPYLATLTDTDGLFKNTPVSAICYDINNPTDVGTVYTGHFAYYTDLASMEATYLVNMLNLDGDNSTSASVRGPIGLAIWQIMFPSSTQTDGSNFPADPAAVTYENQAYQAVTSGLWTVADSNLYPTFMPDNTAAQRFGVILAMAPPVEVSATPEPSSWILLGSALAVTALAKRLMPRACPIVAGTGRSTVSSASPELRSARGACGGY